MGTRPLVSVVMPILNGKPYIDAALASVCGQTLREIEILTVDAGSTDGTLEFLQAKAADDPRIRVISSDQKSMGRQYNLGADAAQGAYLAFCEADDELVPDFLEKAYVAAEAHGFPDVVKLDFMMFTGDGENRYELRYGVLPASARKTLYGKMITLADCPELYFHDVNQWNGIYRRSFVQEHGIRWNETRGAAFQDTGFVQQTLLAAKTLLYLPDIAYRYRRDNEGSSVYKATAPFGLRELRYMMQKFHDHAEWRPYASLLLQRLFTYFCGTYAKDCYLGRNAVTREDIQALQSELKAFLQELDFRVESQHDAPQLPEFLSDFPAFRRHAMRGYLGFREAMASFRDRIEGTDQVVIFSTGERGTAMHAFLHRNHFKGAIAFCDNNPAVQGTMLQGSRIYSPEAAAKTFSEATFVIPLPDYRTSMHCQLLSYGISERQIVDNFCIFPHMAFEVDWEEL